MLIFFLHVYLDFVEVVDICLVKIQKNQFVRNILFLFSKYVIAVAHDCWDSAICDMHVW